MSDPRTKVAQTLGDLLLSNLEMAATLETLSSKVAELEKKLKETPPTKEVKDAVQKGS